MSTVKKEIFYGKDLDHCKNFLMSMTWLKLINYEAFASTILEVARTFFEGKSPGDVWMQYWDDENTFVYLTSDDNLMDVCRCLLIQQVQKCPQTLLFDHESGFQDPQNYLQLNFNNWSSVFCLPLVLPSVAAGFILADVRV